MRLVLAQASEQNSKLTLGGVLDCHTRAVHATRRITAMNFDIGREPSLGRV